jgi:hypothetical protein
MSDPKTAALAAQRRGFYAFPDELKTNPYSAGSDEHALWEDGWNKAFLLMKGRIES